MARRAEGVRAQNSVTAAASVVNFFAAEWTASRTPLAVPPTHSPASFIGGSWAEREGFR